jgi:hypothetical protein
MGGKWGGYVGGLLFVLFFFKFAENALGGGSMNKGDFVVDGSCLHRWAQGRLTVLLEYLGVLK